MNSIEETTKFLKNQVEEEFKNMLDIMRLYYQIDSITDFILDIQLYSQREYSTEPTEARIWLSAPENHLGVNLQLYSIKLSDCDNKITDKATALEIFNSYISYYGLNQDDFKAIAKPKKSEYNPKFNIQFEVSNR